MSIVSDATMRAETEIASGPDVWFVLVRGQGNRTALLETLYAVQLPSSDLGRFRLWDDGEGFDVFFEAADGTLYKVNGEPTIIDDMDEWKQNEWENLKAEFLKEHPFTDPEDKETYESEDEYVTDNIGDVDDIDVPEQMSITDYINDNSLGDVRFEVDGDMECCGGKVLLAFGGPNVWLHDDEICGYWGGGTETWSLCSDASVALMEFFQEEWNAVRGSHSR